MNPGTLKTQTVSHRFVSPLLREARVLPSFTAGSKKHWLGNYFLLIQIQRLDFTFWLLEQPNCERRKLGLWNLQTCSCWGPWTASWAYLNMQSSCGTTPKYTHGRVTRSGLLLVSTAKIHYINVLLALQHLILLSKLLPIRACLH